MLFKNAKTCIKTNGFISKFFSLSRSARQGCLVAQLLYILQAEPMACAIRETYKIKGIKMSGSENVLESNICMYADDTQLFNRNEESVEQTFKVLVKYEKASGSKINYEKTKGLFIGRLIGKLPKFAKISWVTDNIKALGVFHSYDINTDTV